MKANTPELMKFKRLQRKLGETRRGVIGLLESMWIEVARNCPEGDIGRFTDEEIAIMVDWSGDPEVLVKSLVECRWLDRCAERRLVVHDWDDHCPRYVKGGLARQGKVVAKASTSEVEPIGTTLDDQADTSEHDGMEHASTYSSQAKPSQANSNMSASRGQYDEDFEKFWNAFPKTRRTKKQEAFRKWKQALRLADADTLTRRAAEYAMSPKGRSEYAVMPSVWLNSGMWQDEAEAWGESSATAGPDVYELFKRNDWAYSTGDDGTLTLHPGLQYDAGFTELSAKPGWEIVRNGKFPSVRKVVAR